VRTGCDDIGWAAAPGGVARNLGQPVRYGYCGSFLRSWRARLLGPRDRDHPRLTDLTRPGARAGVGAGIGISTFAIVPVADTVTGCRSMRGRIDPCPAVAAQTWPGTQSTATRRRLPGAGPVADGSDGADLCVETSTRVGTNPSRRYRKSQNLVRLRHPQPQPHQDRPPPNLTTPDPATRIEKPRPKSLRPARSPTRHPLLQGQVDAGKPG
jgi:hypothetical protein